MAKKKCVPTSKTVSRVSPFGERKAAFKNFKVQMKKHELWPNLKVRDWRPLALKHFNIEGLHHTDPLFKKIN